MSKLHALILGVPFLAVTVQAQTPAGSARITAPDPTRIERSLRPAVRIPDRADSAFNLADRMRYWHVPGVSIAIIDELGIVFAKGYGVTEFGGTNPVDTTTLFLAGSISKPVFATGALRLVEQGTLTLDDDVNAKLKSWRVPDSKFTETEKVTLRRLLTHSAGLTVWGFPGYAAGTPVPTVPQILDGVKPANTSAVRNDTTPGARWLYSGGGFTVAQLLATDVTGEPFPALMKRLVLEPAGMARSTYDNPLPPARAPEAASGHERVDTPVPGRYHTYPEMAAAGLWTTASDLARWAIALSRAYNGHDTGVLSPGMARQMIAKHVTAAQRYGGGTMGLGVGVDGAGDSLWFSHGGRDEGFVATVAMWPKLGKGFVILTNGVSGALLTEIRRAFADVYGVGAVPRTEQRPVEVDAASLAPLAGRFVLPIQQGRDTIRYDVTFADGVLSLNNTFAKRTMRLWPLGGDTFFDVNTGGTFIFERESSAPDAPARAIRMGRAANAPVALRQ